MSLFLFGSQRKLSYLRFCKINIFFSVVFHRVMRLDAASLLLLAFLTLFCGFQGNTFHSHFRHNNFISLFFPPIYSLSTGNSLLCDIFTNYDERETEKCLQENREKKICWNKREKKRRRLRDWFSDSLNTSALLLYAKRKGADYGKSIDDELSRVKLFSSPETLQ